MKPGDKYRPSNGTEGDWFECEFCMNCRRESKTHPCRILTNAQVFGMDESEFPKEWTYTDEGNPTCTAFSDRREVSNTGPSKAKKRKAVGDLFNDDEVWRAVEEAAKYSDESEEALMAQRSA